MCTKNASIQMNTTNQMIFSKIKKYLYIHYVKFYYKSEVAP